MWDKRASSADFFFLILFYMSDSPQMISKKYMNIKPRSKFSFVMFERTIILPTQL